MEQRFMSETAIRLGHRRSARPSTPSCTPLIPRWARQAGWGSSCNGAGQPGEWEALAGFQPAAASAAAAASLLSQFCKPMVMELLERYATTCTLWNNLPACTVCLPAGAAGAVSLPAGTRRAAHPAPARRLSQPAPPDL
jgi:hypothetical protein